MERTYSTYEAKAKFSEILRKVRAGQKVIISYHGEEIAEIRPRESAGDSFEHRLHRLESEGVLGPPANGHGKLRPLVKRHGALQRFLDSRE